MESTNIIAKLGLLCLISAVTPAVSSGFAAPAKGFAQAAPLTTALTYADLVDLADMSPIVANVRILSVIALPAESVSTMPAGYRRVYIEGQVTTLIRGDGGISPTISYLYDAPLDRRGKLPKLKKGQVLVFARPAARPGQIQLVARDAQIPATPADVERVKRVLSDLVANGAPPRITGLGDAFHVAGTVAGEGETQIFLKTQSREPVSLSILRRPGEAPRWAVALGEIVDEAARPPAPGSLLWYRLACGLPRVLPAPSVRTLAVQDAEAARADYQVVLRSLGQCDRNRAAG